MDAKTELNQFLQRHCARPITKGDCTYKISKFGSQYQAIVKLVCLGGQEFASHLSDSPKEAEKSAAQMALEAHKDEVAAANAAATVASKAVKRKPGSQLSAAAKKARAEAQGVEPAELNPKAQLNNLTRRIVKRHPQKGEMVYEIVKYGDLFQATVKITCLPGEWAERAWRGEAASNKQKAEQNAAEEAVKEISADPVLTEEANKPRPGGKFGGKGGYGWGKGKGWGKGWGWAWAPAWAWGMGDLGMTGEMPRERVTETAVTGEVVEWKGAYGWIKAHAELEHPAAHKRGGKIYVHKKDLAAGLEELAEGLGVSFHIYEDPTGLGAEEVTIT